MVPKSNRLRNHNGASGSGRLTDRSTFYDSGPAELLIGMEGFYTQNVGVGGRLRAEPEDFIVEELSILPEECADGCGWGV